MTPTVCVTQRWDPSIYPSVCRNNPSHLAPRCPSPGGAQTPPGGRGHRLHLSSRPCLLTLPLCFRSKLLGAEHKIPSVPFVRESKEELLLLLARLGFVELPQSSVYHAIELEAHA